MALVVKKMAQQNVRGGLICETRCAACNKVIKHAYEARECVVDVDGKMFSVMVCPDHAKSSLGILASYIQEHIYGPQLPETPTE